jgi:hypothetical protein
MEVQWNACLPPRRRDQLVRRVVVGSSNAGNGFRATAQIATIQAAPGDLGNANLKF